MGRKKKEETVVEEKPKKRGRPKVSEGAASAPKIDKKKKKAKSIYDDDGEILSLDDIKNSLLKKAKSSGIIDQSDIYDALAQFELDDDTINDLIVFFKDNGIEVITDEDDEDEDFEDFDESKMNLDEEPDDDFFAEEDGEEVEEDIDIDYLGSEVRINDSVKMYLKEIGKYDLLKAEDEPILAQKILDITSAITPHVKPFTNPAIMLLYSGAEFCANTIMIGDANIVNPPARINAVIATDGIERYVITNSIKSGRVETREKYKTGFVPNFFST